MKKTPIEKIHILETKPTDEFALAKDVKLIALKINEIISALQDTTEEERKMCVTYGNKNGKSFTLHQGQCTDCNKVTKLKVQHVYYDSIPNFTKTQENIDKLIPPPTEEVEKSCCPKCNFKRVAHDSDKLSYFGGEYCGKLDCECHLSPPTEESWQKEFDNEFDFYENEPIYGDENRRKKIRIKEFIYKLLHKQKEKLHLLK